MTRPAWLDVVAEICGGEVEDWREIGAHGGTWRWRDEDDTERRWLADDDSVWHEGGGLWVEARCSGGEVDHARLARAVLAGLAVARGDLDVDALQQQVATLTRERDGLAAERATLHTFLTAAAEPESYPDDPRLFALSAEQERLITAYAARWRAECKAADKERAEIAARLAALVGPVGSLVPDAPGWWWRDFDDSNGPIPVWVGDGGITESGLWYSCAGDEDEPIPDGFWFGPVAPPRGAR